MMHFRIRFFTRLGVVLGSSWGRFGGQNATQNFSRDLSWTVLSALEFDLSIFWTQDGSKTVPRGLLGGSWAVLGGVWGRSWELLGSIWAVLGLVLDHLGVLGRVWAALGGSWALFGGSWRAFGPC